MLCFRLSTTLLLAAMCLLNPAVASIQQMVTCGSGGNVHQLTCVDGVIRVQTALYGRQDSDTCSAGVNAAQRTDTSCSQSGILDIVKGRCDGKKVCELNIDDVDDTDPCPGTNKYLSTTYDCYPESRVIACEGSVARLHCRGGQTIYVYDANYGRTDDVPCSFDRPSGQVQKVDCLYSGSTDKVSDSCNGKTSCTIDATNAVFGDPCRGTYKYLEVIYICQYSKPYYPRRRPYYKRPHHGFRYGFLHHGRW